VKGAMIMNRKSPVDVKKLTKKYKVDVNKIIKGWKADKTDTEISQALNVDLLKLMQLRQEIEDAHLQDRLQKRKNEKFSDKV
jgi:DNA-directed RNA polymerase specialized sigma subunit